MHLLSTCGFTGGRLWRNLQSPLLAAKSIVGHVESSDNGCIDICPLDLGRCLFFTCGKWNLIALIWSSIGREPSGPVKTPLDYNKERCSI